MMNRIQKQYQTSKNLDIRISIHQKYSVNKKPFGDWIFSHYEFSSGIRVLELGCGTADMWKGKQDMIKDDIHLTLTDFSSGMLEKAKCNTLELTNVDYQVVDIQSIPFAQDSFDMVIANMMLYHVPKLHQGLAEVRRVLKPGGKFYCATYGEHGIMEFVNYALRELGISGEIGKTFTLQNGAGILKEHFEDITMYTRDDGLAVSYIPDFVDYVMSLSSLTGLEGVERKTLIEAFLRRADNGILYVPKEYGMFICK